MKFLEPTRKPKVIYTDNSLEFGKSCEEFSWNHCTSTPHRSETNGVAERAVLRVKRRDICGTVAIRSGQRMVGGFHGMLLLSAKTFKISCLMGRHHVKGGSECFSTDQWYLWSNGRISPYFCEGHVGRTVHAERRIISYSVEVRRRHQNYTNVTGCIVGETDRILLERRGRSRIVRCMHKIHFIERKATWRMDVVQEETDEETNNPKTRQCMARYVEAYLWCSEK